MESRARWQALQAKISAARTALEAGDRTRALREIDAALEIDPDYLAAQALKDRIAAAAAIVTTPLSAANAAPRQIVSAEQYARFEERARRRRVDRRLDAARLGIASGRWKDAAAALDEVAELDPNLPDLARLVAQVEQMRLATSGRRRFGPWLAAAAVFAALVLGASWIEQTTYVLSRPIPAAPPLVADRLAEPAPVPLPDVAAPLESTPLGAISGIALVTPPATVDMVAAPPPLPSPRASDSPVVAAVRQVSPPPPAPPVETRPALPAPGDPSALLPEAGLPAAPVAQASNARTVVEPDPIRTVPDRLPPPARPAVVDDETLVRQVLQRYRTAYEALDAQSAQAVWPTVNEAALARAFDSLEWQRLTFEGCTVQVGNDRAAATCRGTARYVPKVGNRDARTEPRTWTFALSKAGPEWKIDAARAER